MGEGTTDDGLGALAGGRYRLQEVLGTGASATVYRATDTALGVVRAIKVLHPRAFVSDSVRHRLKAEARAMARLDHRHVLRIYDVGEHEGRAYVVMDLAPGGNLATVVHGGGPLPERQALGYALQVLSALAEAHGRGIIHRDVKPHNILLDDEGLAMLADFGIALYGEEEGFRSTRTGTMLGTLAFMAPEQRIDARSVGPPADLYAVASTLFFLVTGDNPVDLFAAGPDSPRWTGISAVTRDVLWKATRYEAPERYPSAAAMAREVGRARDLAPTEAPPPGRERRPPPVAPTLAWESATDDAHTFLLQDLPPDRRGALWGAAAVATAAVAVLAWAMWASSPTTVVLPAVAPSTVPGPVPEAAVARVAPEQPAVEPPTAVVVPEARPVPAPRPAATPLMQGPPPLGGWTGSFAGRPASLTLRGTLDALTGEVTVRFRDNEVATPVAGTYDAQSRVVRLEDALDAADAGVYTATLSADGNGLEGRFEGHHDGRVALFVLERQR